VTTQSLVFAFALCYRTRENHHHHHHRLELEMAYVCGHKQQPWRFEAVSDWKPRRNQKSLLVSMVIKRSPKRLKYTADTTRFNKVGHTLFFSSSSFSLY
jgi:hypothetical protein